MSMMIYVLVLCGLALEAFRLSIAAGAIQANLTKRKIILSGRNFRSSTTCFVFAGNGMPMEVDGFPLSF